MQRRYTRLIMCSFEGYESSSSITHSDLYHLYQNEPEITINNTTLALIKRPSRLSKVSCEKETDYLSLLSENGDQIPSDTQLTPEFEKSPFLINNELGSPEEFLDKAKGFGCTCKKSMCLRLHCKCFSASGYCLPSCKCQGCMNNIQNEETRNFVIEKTKIIFPSAFQPKIIFCDADDVKVNAAGCRCSKGCKKKYCECVKSGAGCTAFCKCNNCSNAAHNFTSDKLKNVIVKPVRRKHKILFNKASDSDEKEFCTVEFSIYKRS